MDVKDEYFYVTPDELDAGILADTHTAWNAACTQRNFLLHNGDWHFRLGVNHLEEFTASLRATAALSEPTPPQLRFQRGQKLARTMLEQLSTQ